MTDGGLVREYRLSITGDCHTGDLFVLPCRAYRRSAKFLTFMRFDRLKP